MAFKSSKRLSYDKLIKQVLDQFHQEFDLVQQIAATQRTIISQNEKILAMLSSNGNEAVHRPEDSTYSENEEC